MPLTTRPATADDADAVTALVQSAYRGEASRAGWTTEADLLDGQRTDPAMVRDLVTRPGNAVLLGHDDGELVACCHLERRAPDLGHDGTPTPAPTAYLGMFAVRPGRQGRGLGRGVLAAAEAFVRDAWGAAALDITVLNHRTELIAWYERRGFVLTGEEHPFPYGDPRYGLPLRDDLALLGMRRPVAVPARGTSTAVPARGTSTPG